jgi:hypothetical protein
MTRGAASAKIGSEAMCPMEGKIGGSRQRGGGSMMRKRESAMVHGLRGGRDGTRKVRLGTVDTVLDPLRKTRRGRNDDGDDDGTHRGARAGVGALMEQPTRGGLKAAEVKHLPGSIAHILLRISTIKATFHGGTDTGGVWQVLA